MMSRRQHASVKLGRDMGRQGESTLPAWGWNIACETSRRDSVMKRAIIASTSHLLVPCGHGR